MLGLRHSPCGPSSLLASLNRTAPRAAPVQAMASPRVQSAGPVSSNAWTLAACTIAFLLTVTALWANTVPDSAGTVRNLLGREQPISALGVPRSECGASTSNKALRSWISHAASDPTDPVLPQSNSFDEFILELKASIDRHMLPNRSIDFIFSDESVVPPACDGDWMEFGVYTGGSVNKTANWRRRHCPQSCPPVYGFDTFTGLAEDWNPDDKTVFTKSSFSQGGNFPPVEDNVFLVKGLYSDSLPPFLQQQKAWASGFRQRGTYHPAPLTYLHIDCDLFAGSHDALTLLSHKIIPGTVIVFDELINYKRYREHEVKALWMWLQVSGAKIATIGTKGPLPGTNYAMDMDVALGHAQESQGSAFVVVSRPGMPSL